MNDEDLAAIRMRHKSKSFRDQTWVDMENLLAEVERLRTEKTETALQRLVELGQEMDNE